MRRNVFVGAALLSSVLVVCGCVERRETIRIEPDGLVRIEIVHETGSYEELYQGDAVPTLEAGWVVTEHVERRDDGSERYRISAEGIFAPGEPLPASYGDPRNEHADAVLRFPTRVMIHDRADGRYCHFFRQYRARRWAFLEGARTALKKALEEMEEDDFEAMSASQRGTLIRHLIDFQTAKYRAFARAAWLDVLAGEPQDVWLRLRAEVLAAAEGMDFERILARLVDEDDDLREEALEEESQRFERTVLEAMRHALRDPAASKRVAADRVNAFFDRLRWHQRAFEVTEDLADDAFFITVELPGEIVGHNGERADGSSVTWRFGGDLLRDADLELMATSRIAAVP